MDFDLQTRIGRVQAAWWLRDRGAPQDVMPPGWRIAYRDALHGYECDVEALAALVEKYREQP